MFSGLSFKDSVLSTSKGSENVRLSSGKTIVLKTRQRDRSVDLAPCLSDNNSMDVLMGNLDIEKVVQKPRFTPKPKRLKSDKVLWTEKWRPSTYLDLLGNERINRLTLEWLSQWSKVVFNTPNDMTEKNRELGDPYGRPHRKILLLNGPPGIGKTSIAHVIAKQVGYEVLEINASDERAGTSVRDKIRNSLSSVTFSGKPTCLVIDEIDGSTETGFIKVLLEILNEDDRAQVKSKKKAKFLMRPIIAVCNDLYASCLEKLRPRAEIITMRHPPRRAIKERLRKICKAESLAFSDPNLEAVAETCNFDMRGCLNMLQFSGGSSIKNGGGKDLQTSWFNLVKTTFTRDNSLKLGQQFAQLEKLLLVSDEKVLNGCFNAYLNVGYQNIDLTRCDAMTDWLYFADAAGNLQDSYSSLAVLKFYLLFSGTSTEVKTSNLSEFYENRRRYAQMLRYFNTAVSIPTLDLVKYVIPFASSILTLNLKVSIHNMKPNEKAKLETIKNVMKQFGVKVERSSTGLELYPPIDSLCHFSEQSLRQHQQKKQPLLILLNEERILKRKPEPLEERPTKRNVSADFFKKQYGEIVEAPIKNNENRIWVKYHEGFSDAVKKNIRWSDLF
ncbi:unnamed protein product [Kuraishia capsulata CBS 1993]|uniref:AAA+ ATPase domain-containing protein n=1 Tax=Kuraishia capsulata CBS 1993 TaxID=1382522 RepID=W6MVG1_9ASCO|nr:uncharacterized protein KUCA_T00005931001 [Kuraishia capsulata CBS 1993]CDK29937.1 unnamed protein product [Kuraishia capsulata CBS 1993]